MSAIATKPIGRPRKWQSVEELESGIEAYFAQRKADKLPPTVTGLAIALGTTRRTLLDWQSGERSDGAGFSEVNGGKPDPRFAHAIKVAKARCEDYLEGALLGAGVKTHPAGPIFCLKNNFGWKDTQEVAHTHALVVLGQPGRQLDAPTFDVEVLSAGEDPTLSPVENARQGEGVENR